LRIDFVEIQNYRKLKCCRIDFSNKTTIFVGANNSGKTSAMDALIFFLKDKKYIFTTDFTLSNWGKIEKLVKNWTDEDKDPESFSISEWQEWLPTLDVWLQASESEIHYISHLIPTLDWEIGRLGIRFCLEPKDIEKLYKDYKKSFLQAKKTMQSSDHDLKLWPTSMRDFLEKRLRAYFTIRSYILDPEKYEQSSDGTSKPQVLDLNNPPLNDDPFKGLIKVNVINAQRGFSDPHSGMNSDDHSEAGKGRGSLSSQLQSYYEHHIDPYKLPEEKDIDALQAINDAQDIFEKKMKEGLSVALMELQSLGYPGFTDPNLKISCRVNPIDTLNHPTAVQFNPTREEDNEGMYALPEKYNGLGYQNLISMVFNLMRFRDDWMQVGKVEIMQEGEAESSFFEPIHLVLIEEPEAHLHAQVQQVFIRKAYGVLRNHPELGNDKNFSTQLVVSTHSSHIAHEIDFSSLRYFRRMKPEKEEIIPCAQVINLSDTFGSGDETSKFTARYLKTTHCDLFFADAAILIEGAAERILFPHFIRGRFEELHSCYISLLEVGGSHAHRLKGLIENLGIITLIVTDLDSVDPQDGRKSVQPVKEKGLESANDTLSKWIPELNSIDALWDLTFDKKIHPSLPIRVAYQTPVKVEISSKSDTIQPYTFEDSLALENISIISSIDGTGLLKKFKNSIATAADPKDLNSKMIENLTKSNKAAFALDLLFLTDPTELEVPPYIAEGFNWISEMLNSNNEQTLTEISEN
jgi:predicted ATP-dependent endonuclease of OLD family